MEIWHNPRCSKSREALALLHDAGVEPTVRRYLDDPPTAAELRGVLAMLGIEPWEVVRFGEQVARDLGLGDRPREDPDAWIDLMASNPRLIERPIVVTDDRAVLGRPPDRVLVLVP
jgi:arsenate reductase